MPSSFCFRIVTPNKNTFLLFMCFPQLAILLPSLPPIATPSQPRVMEPVVMTALLLLLLQLPPSLTALSQGILPSLLTLVMASRLLPLHHRGMYPLTRNRISEFHKYILFTLFVLLCLSVTMRTASRLVTTKIATPSQQHMASNSLATRPSRQATASSRGTSNRPSSHNRLLLLTLLRLLVPMGSLQPTNTASKVAHLVTTSPTITVSLAFHPCLTAVLIFMDTVQPL